MFLKQISVFLFSLCIGSGAVAETIHARGKIATSLHHTEAHVNPLHLLKIPFAIVAFPAATAICRDVNMTGCSPYQEFEETISERVHSAVSVESTDAKAIRFTLESDNLDGCDGISLILKGDEKDQGIYELSGLEGEQKVAELTVMSKRMYLKFSQSVSLNTSDSKGRACTWTLDKDSSFPLEIRKQRN